MTYLYSLTFEDLNRFFSQSLYVVVQGLHEEVPGMDPNPDISSALTLARLLLLPREADILYTDGPFRTQPLSRLPRQSPRCESQRTPTTIVVRGHPTSSGSHAHGKPSQLCAFQVGERGEE
jgi:hypothetical protein